MPDSLYRRDALQELPNDSSGEFAAADWRPVSPCIRCAPDGSCLESSPDSHGVSYQTSAARKQSTRDDRDASPIFLEPYRDRSMYDIDRSPVVGYGIVDDTLVKVDVSRLWCG